MTRSSHVEPSTSFLSINRTHAVSDTSPPDASAIADLSFEEALNRLESIVEQLEDDPPALSESLDAYEEGVEIARSCLERLNQAEQRVNELDIDA